MRIKHKIHNLVSPLYNKVWHVPKGKISARIREACDRLPRKKRLAIVWILFTLFVLSAFYVFGTACYRMGAGHERRRIETGHIRQLDIVSNPPCHEFWR